MAGSLHDFSDSQVLACICLNVMPLNMQNMKLYLGINTCVKFVLDLTC